MNAITRARLNAVAGETDDGPNDFLLNVSGHKSGLFRGYDLAHVRLFLRPRLANRDGPMLAKRSQYSVNETSRSGASVVWNFPISSTFSSTNAFGWPRLVLTVVDRTLTVRGYGAVLIPTTSGKHTRYVHMFAPVASSPLQEFLGWLVNAPAEFRDNKFPARSGDREVTRVKSGGVIKVTFNVTTKSMGYFGYTEGKTLKTAK